MSLTYCKKVGRRTHSIYNRYQIFYGAVFHVDEVLIPRWENRAAHGICAENCEEMFQPAAVLTWVLEAELLQPAWRLT